MSKLQAVIAWLKATNLSSVILYAGCFLAGWLFAKL